MVVDIRLGAVEDTSSIFDRSRAFLGLEAASLQLSQRVLDSALIAR